MPAGTSSGLVALLLLASGLAGPAAPRSSSVADPISGTWDVTFHVEGYPPTPATFELKLNRTRLTGTIQSEHTGSGDVTEGSWERGKLSFVAVFKNHESIAVTGTLADGNLAGEFTTEGFTAKWEAVKRPKASTRP